MSNNITFKRNLFLGDSYPNEWSRMFWLANDTNVTIINNKSKVLLLTLGVLLSVTIYYITYFFNTLGETKQFSNLLSIWLPIITLGIITFFGLIKINEK